MNIAMFTNCYKPFIGGVPISIERLSKGLRELGHQVTIFAPRDGSGTQEPGVVYYQILYQRKEQGMYFGNCFDLNIEKEFKRVKFDVIHAHHPVLSGYAALYFGRKYYIPVAYTYHTRYEEYLHYFEFFRKMQARGGFMGELTDYSKKVLMPKYMKAFANHCDLVFAPTHMMKEHLLESGVHTEVSILPTGLSSQAFVRDEERAAKIRQEYLGNRKYLFCTVARLEKEKNLPFLLKGIARLKEMMGSKFCLLVVGDGKERHNLEQMAAGLGISEDVVFLGKVPNEEIRHYQFAADAFLFASKSETQGIVLLEAMAAGKPVVAVSASGVSDIVIDGYNGFLTEESEDLWAKAVFETVRDLNTLQKLGQGALGSANHYRQASIALEAQKQYHIMIEGEKFHEDNETDKKGVFSSALFHLFKVS